MNKTSNIPQIFLSYDDIDLVPTEEIYDSLALKGFRPWMVYRDITPGDNVQNKIMEATESSDGILVIISQNIVNDGTITSDAVNKTIQFWSEKLDWKGLLIPVRLEKCVLPSVFRDLSPADLFEKSGWNDLLSSLRNRFFPDLFANTMSRYEKYEKSLGLSSDPSKESVFVAMPFNDSYLDLYVGIAQAVQNVGLRCIRVDQEVFTGDIINWMNNNIEKSKFVIAEITEPNPNVYLEVGYALAKGIPIIFIARGKHITGIDHLIPFDIRTQRVIYYQGIIEITRRLEYELKSLMGDVPKNS